MTRLVGNGQERSQVLIGGLVAASPPPVPHRKDRRLPGEVSEKPPECGDVVGRSSSGLDGTGAREAAQARSITLTDQHVRRPDAVVHQSHVVQVGHGLRDRADDPSGSLRRDRVERARWPAAVRGVQLGAIVEREEVDQLDDARMPGVIEPSCFDLELSHLMLTPGALDRDGPALASNQPNARAHVWR